MKTHHNFDTTEQLETALSQVRKAIDSIIDLEGGKVFPNGLPSEFSKSLDRLRHEEAVLENIAEHWH